MKFNEFDDRHDIKKTNSFSDILGYKVTGLLLIIVISFFLFSKTYDFFNVNKISPTYLSINCPSYFLSKDNNILQCDLIVLPTNASSAVNWEFNSDYLSVDNNSIILNEDINLDNDISIDVIVRSKMDTNVYDTMTLKLLSNEEKISSVPSCNLSISKERIIVGDSFNVMILCENKFEMKYNNKDILYNTSILNLSNISTITNDSLKIQYMYTFNTLQPIDTSITIPNDFVISDIMGNSKKTITLPIENLNYSNLPDGDNQDSNPSNDASPNVNDQGSNPSNDASPNVDDQGSSPSSDDNHSDKVAPIIRYSIGGGAYNVNKTVIINVSDENSGIEKFQVNVYKNGVMDVNLSLNSTTKQEHTVVLSSDGTWRIEAFAIDKVGNKSSGEPLTNTGWYYQEYIIDTTPPIIKYSENGGTYNSTKTIKIDVSDETSGIKEFRINVYKNGIKDETRSTNKITDKTSHSINLGGNGIWRIETYAFDKVNNKNSGSDLTNAGWYYQTYTIDIMSKNNYIHFIKLPKAADAILLQSNGHFALIDTGYNSDVDTIKNYFSHIGIKKLDFILITHFDGDHMGSLKQLLTDIPVDNLYIKTLKKVFYKTDSSISLYNQIISLANSKSVKIKYTDKLNSDVGMYWFKMEQMSFVLYNINYLVNARDENEQSIVTYIKIGTTKTVLTGDAINTEQFSKVFSKLASATQGKVDILKVPHHGSDFCALQTEALHPTTIITTASSKDNIKQECYGIYGNAKNYFVNDIKNKAIVVEYSDNSTKIIQK